MRDKTTGCHNLLLSGSVTKYILNKYIYIYIIILKEALIYLPGDEITKFLIFRERRSRECRTVKSRDLGQLPVEKRHPETFKKKVINGNYRPTAKNASENVLKVLKRVSDGYCVIHLVTQLSVRTKEWAWLSNRDGYCISRAVTQLSETKARGRGLVFSRRHLGGV